MTAEALGQPGQVIDGKYRIIRLLGTGGMGAVYEGENIRIRRKVAIKMLHGSVSSQADVVMRFEREAQAAALVGSDHICEVLDLGELPDTTRYMVMEYLDGETLSGRIKRMGRLHPTQSIPMLLQILEALGKAHAAGIIHRDLKPDNVFILPQKSGVQNFIKILDFGVSKFSQLGGEAMNVTRAGAVVGTPYYMSPEQARGTSAIDQRTDIYAIGVLLYQATTGQVPYQAETFNELLFKIVLEVAPPPQTYAPDLDPDFAAIIQRAMAREPEQRFQTCREFADALSQYQNARAFQMPNVQRGGGPQPQPTQVLDLQAFNAQQQAWGPPQQQMNASMPGMQPGMNASMPGMQQGMSASMPGMQPGMSASMPGMQPQNASGSNWQAASGAGAPTATANSWGNASGMDDAAPKPKSKGPLIGIIAAVVVLAGGTAAALMFMGKPGKAATPGGAETAQSATPPPVTASAAPPPVTATAEPPAPPTTSAAAPPPAPPTATAQVVVKPPPGPAPGPKPGPAKPPPGPKPGPKPKPGKSGGDLGY